MIPMIQYRQMYRNMRNLYMDYSDFDSENIDAQFSYRTKNKFVFLIAEIGGQV